MFVRISCCKPGFSDPEPKFRDAPQTSHKHIPRPYLSSPVHFGVGRTKRRGTPGGRIPVAYLYWKQLWHSVRAPILGLKTVTSGRPGFESCHCDFILVLRGHAARQKVAGSIPGRGIFRNVRKRAILTPILRYHWSSSCATEAKRTFPTPDQNFEMRHKTHKSTLRAHI